MTGKEDCSKREQQGLWVLVNEKPLEGLGEGMVSSVYVSQRSLRMLGGDWNENGRGRGRGLRDTH